jgi:6-phospho-3-hexuloisomerase
MDYRTHTATVVAELGRVFERVDLAQVEALVVEITRAPRVFCVGVGREGLATRAFAMRLAHLGIVSHWVWDDTTPALQPGDLLVATSGGGEIGHIHYVVERARAAGGRIAVVTGDPFRTTPAAADVLLFVPAAVYRGTADVVASIQPMGNLFEQALLILFDAIAVDLKDRLGTSFEQMEARHRNLE